MEFVLVAWLAVVGRQWKEGRRATARGTEPGWERRRSGRADWSGIEMIVVGGEQCNNCSDLRQPKACRCEPPDLEKSKIGRDHEQSFLLER
jgi:hypothetical protein